MHKYGANKAAIEWTTFFQRMWSVLAFVLFSNLTFASHIVGGEMYYDYLGNNNYRVFISIYRDCNSTGAEFDEQLPMGIFNSSGTLIENRLIPFPGKQNLPIIFNNPCINPPNGICTERAIYQTVVNLPPINGGYTLSYQRCCRGPAIVNLNAPDDTGLTLVSKIPGAETGQFANSSPRFSNYPPLVICNNDELEFNHVATDPDGDQLVYSLFTPNEGATPGSPAPSPPPPPPYAPVSWRPGHSAANPLGPGSIMNLDASNGFLTAQPNIPGKYVVGVKVDELRNGVVINSSIRDFLFVVITCDITMKAILPTQEQLSTFESYCDGLTVDFENNSFGGTAYAWDFGVPGVTSDVSTAFEPTFTYPADGNYVVRLIVNPGQPCTDTTYMDVRVQNEIAVDFTATDSVCFEGHSIDFIGTSNGRPGSVYDWTFGPDASQNTVSGQTVVNGITYNMAGVFPTILKVVDGECEGDTTINVYIFDLPVADFDLPEDYPCGGQTVTFTNLSTSSFNFEWDFGEPGSLDVSTAKDPSWTYNNPGIYTIQLIAGSTGNCFDTVEHSFEIYKDLIMSFTNNDSLCIVDNAFDFIGTVSGPSETIYTWNFGPNTTPSNSNDTSVFGVNFATAGNHNVSLSGAYLMCEQTVNSSIFIFKEPTIEFTIKMAKQCVPFAAQFIDQSIADTEIFYEWDFGDGNTSTIKNPSNLYVDTGQFVVSLTIRTDAGCIDTLTLSRDDLVHVRPRPTAGFSLSSDAIDICPGLITFYDQSEGGVKFTYYPDDLGISAVNVPAIYDYTYSTSGNKNVLQIIENQYGCKDSTRQRLAVYPYTVFVPNVFTPNGDQFNNNFFAVAAMPAEEWELNVFNRWGKLVFQSSNQDDLWDGTVQGKDAPDGVYTYTLKLLACGKEDRKRTFSGHINLLR
jgi:gliding motility-associated-like protein